MRGARRPIAGLTCAVAAATLAAIASLATPSALPAAQRRMSFHNRLLLNRAAIAKLPAVEVALLLAQTGQAATTPAARIAAAIVRIGGQVHRTETAIGYLRADIPTDRLVELVSADDIAAYQITSNSRGAWYRDGPPMRNAEFFRGYEVTPIAPVVRPARHPELPPLSVAESRERGFTADDAGVEQWLRDHPTFDGRGVTIALIENALPAFADSTLRGAKTLDGRDVPKIAGIVNVPNARLADETRVPLDTVVEARRSWVRVGSRTYVLPRPGAYRFGVFEVPAGANVIHQFGVLEDPASGELWVDANGDASFQDETPLADVNERFEPRQLSLAFPNKVTVSFVAARGREPHVVHIYLGKGSHQTMTVSVAAGSRTDDSLAYGVAPNARVLLVRIASTDAALAKTFEGFIEAAQRPEVDVISSSSSLMPIPDSAADFAGTLFARLVAVYGKPIVNAAGNNSPLVGSTHALGGALTVGGILAPPTWTALYGGRSLRTTIVNPISSAGPAIDGAIKPDFLAPMERLAADLPWNAEIEGAPRIAPTRRVPAGYQISCCTSATSPYAAGVVALLISAAKQTATPYPSDRLNRALRMSARLLPDVVSHRQGNGVIDVDGAWRELQRSNDTIRIESSAAIVHPLAQYAARGPSGQGIFEFEGWTAGMRATRTIDLERQTGPAGPATYRVDWSATDGAFAAPSSVTLPLRQRVALPIAIDVRSAGVHSGLLNLRDVRTGTLAFRTQATIVATAALDAATQSTRLTGTLGLMQDRTHYIRVPPDVAAIAFELRVLRGVVQPTIVPAHGLFPAYYMHAYPMNVFFLAKGTYVVRVPNPAAGTWALQLNTGSSWFNIPGSPVKPDDEDAEYAVTVRLEASSIHTVTNGGAVAAHVTNNGGAIGEPMFEATAGYLASHHARLRADGLPNVVDIDVPRDAATLVLQLRSESAGTNAELYLYDCTRGECFSYNIGFPAAGAHTLAVRKPNAGRWVAAINAAPFPLAAGAFALDELVTMGPSVRKASAPRSHGAQWRESIERLPAAPAAVPGRVPVVVIELIDAAAERAEEQHPWSTAPNYVKLRDRPIALARTIYRR